LRQIFSYLLTTYYTYCRSRRTDKLEIITQYY